MKDSEIGIYFVVNLHWDREWFMPYESARVRFVSLVDHFLTMLTRPDGLPCILLDGASRLVRDYLEVNPDKEAIVRELISSKKLIVGPWYVQPDFFLISGESIVRNLLVGMQYARSFGYSGKTAYVPDSPGMPSQLPQILRKVGVESAVFHRGVPKIPQDIEFQWEGADGSKVNAIFLPRGHNICHSGLLAQDKNVATQNVLSLVELYLPICRSNHLLLMVNAKTPLDHLPAVFREVSDAIKPIRTTVGSLEGFVDSLDWSTLGCNLVNSELRSSDKSFIFPGVLTARAHLKRLNAICEHALFDLAERFSSLAYRLGSPYPRGLLRTAVQYLLENQEQDSIGGNHTDAVELDIQSRYRWIRQICGELTTAAMSFIGDRLGHPGFEDGDILFAVFNPNPWMTSAYVEAEFIIEGCEKLPESFDLYDPYNKPMYGEMVSTEKGIWLKYAPLRRPKEVEGTLVRFRFQAEDIPPIGAAVYRLHPGLNRWTFDESVGISNNTFFNEHLDVTVTDDGSLTILDKATGFIWEHVNSFVDGGDAGDLYTYEPPPRDVIITTLNQRPTVVMIDEHPFRCGAKISWNLRVPARLTPNRETREDAFVDLSIISEVMLRRGSKSLEFKTTVTNTALDHRLRVTFPLPEEPYQVKAGSPFDTLSRPTKVVALRGTEKPSSSWPMYHYVGVQNSKGRGFVIGIHGASDYEVIDGQLAITVLRSTGWINRSDLRTRKWTLELPVKSDGGQCQGRNEIEYVLVLSDGDFVSSGALRRVHEWALPVRAFTGVAQRIGTSFLPGISIGDCCVELTAVKQAESGEGLVIRLANLSSEYREVPIEVSDALGLSTWRIVNLLEEETCNCGPLWESGKPARIRMAPKEIVTLKLE